MNNPEYYADYNKKWQASNPDLVSEKNKRWRKNNPDKAAASTKRHRAANRELYIEQGKKWRAEHPSYAKDWQTRNADKVCFYARRYQASKLNASPLWLTDEDQEIMLSLYTEAKKQQDETGIAHEVDHIVPLQHRLVCGLHVPWNLRIIPKIDNRQKSNRLIVVTDKGETD